MSADPYPSGEPDHDDDLGALVRALGALVGWDGATYTLCGPAGQPPVVARTWLAADGPDGGVGGGGSVTIVPPRAAEVLEPEAWRDRRVLVHGADDATGSPQDARAISVPVWTGDRLLGVLTFVGASLRDPSDAEVAVLEAAAAMVGRASRLAGAAAPPPPAGTPVERAIALVDVFAFTVEVSDEGGLEWRYFGPNSATVFGVPVSTDEGLVALVERHAHPDDLLAVRELEQAATTGASLEVEIRVQGGDDVERWVSWRTAPRTVDGALHVDGVATDVSSRHSLGRSRRELEQANEEYARQVDLRRRHALAVRDANDNVLQRIFAAGLRLQILRRKLDDVEAHAASTIAFQLDQAATDLRELILDLNAVIGELPDPGR